MNNAELLYYINKIIEKSLSNGDAPTNKSWLAITLGISIASVNKIFVFAEDNDIFIGNVVRLSPTKFETRILKKRDFTNREKDLIALFTKFKYADTLELKISIISEFSDKFTDKEIYESINMSKASFYRLKSSPSIEGLQKKLEHLKADVWDLRMQVHAKTAELDKVRNEKTMGSYQELDNARKQVEHIIGMYDKLLKENNTLKKELQRVKGSVRIENYSNLKHLN